MTDRERDIQIAESLVGKPNDFFKNIWLEFASAYGWDGAPCSEIACCISYMAGNLNKILVSNYAAGLVNKFKQAGIFGHEPAIGAFIWFDYKDGNGPSHTGRVIDVQGNYVFTIEGNIGGKVVRRSYLKDTYYIYGYGYPGYDDKPEQTQQTTEPEPTPTTTPKEEKPVAEKEKQYFKDVTPDMSAYRAIQWAKRQGIVQGYKDGTFRPSATCTRAQVVTMLWRMAGKP